MATTTNVPSSNFEDLQRDVQDATKYSNSKTAYINRAGEVIKPIPLQAQEISANLAASEQALANSGFIPKGDFTAGGTVEAKNEIFSDGTDYWRYDGTLPFTVAAGSNPTPTGVGEWINVTDGALRSQLAADDSTSLVAGVEAGKLVKKLGSSVFVTEYGAKGDGSNDDTAACNSALDFIVSQGGGELVFPKGDYLFTSSLFATLTGEPKIKIRGEKGAKLIADASFAAGKFILLLSGGVTGGSVKVEGLEIDASNIPNSGAGQANDAVYISGAFDEVAVKDCNIYAGETFNASGSDSGVFIGEASRMSVEGCSIKGFPDAGLYISGDAAGSIGENFTARNNDIEECAVGIITKRVHKKSIVSENYIKKCPNGIAGGEANGLSSGTSMVITGNVLERCDVGISPRIDSGSIVTGNHILESGYSSSSAAIKGIVLQGASNCVVTGNTLDGLNPDIGTKNSGMIGIGQERRTYESVDYDPDNNIVALNNINGFGTGIKTDSVVTNARILLNSIEDTTAQYNLSGDYYRQDGNSFLMGGLIDGSGFEVSYNPSTDILSFLSMADVRISTRSIASSSRATGGTGSAGAGNQYVELNVAGTTYKVLHDGTV